MQLQISAAQPDLSAENLPSLETLLLFELPLFVLQLGNLITLTLLYLPWPRTSETALSHEEFRPGRAVPKQVWLPDAQLLCEIV